MKITYLLFVGTLLSAVPVFLGMASAVAPAAPPSVYLAPPELPDLLLTTTQGNQLNAQALEGKTVLVLFQSGCDHCQREAEAIQKHLSSFAEYNLYFVTSAPMPDIQQFAKDYRLNEQENVFFAATDVPAILKNFGAIPTPSLYIYSDQQKLVKAFEGESSIEEILKYL